MNPAIQMKKTPEAKGFTLVEILLTIVTLALLTTAVSAVYVTGFQSTDQQNHGMVLDSALRGQMELLLSKDFATILPDSRSIAVEGTSYTFSCTVSQADLDGDSVPEPTAKRVTMQIDETPERSLSVIVVDHEGKLNKF